MTRCAPTPDDGCCATPRLPRGATLRQAVDHYITHHRPRAREEHRRFGCLESIVDAVDRAARCTDHCGKRHSHQRRIPSASLERLRRHLSAVDLFRAGSFDELHDMVQVAGDDIHMIGPLTTYDVATRLGAYLNHEPDRVYLHAGTRDGARALGLDASSKTIEQFELPREFRRLSAAECEDALCIYRDYFASAMRRSRRWSVAAASHRL